MTSLGFKVLQLVLREMEGRIKESIVPGIQNTCLPLKNGTSTSSCKFTSGNLSEEHKNINPERHIMHIGVHCSTRYNI